MSRSTPLSPAKLARSRRIGSALYITVVGTTMIVAVLGMASLSMVRVERRQASTVNDRLLARSHARSAVELALKVINNTPGWRSAYANGVETTPQSLGAASPGAVSWKIADSDGSLTNPDVKLRLKGVGRVGTTVQVSSIEVQPGSVGPAQLREMASGSLSGDKLALDKWFCQYVKVTLPPEAIGWRVSAVEIYAKRENSSRPFYVRLYQPQANNMPSATLIDSATANSNSAGALFWGWVTIPLNGYYWLDPNSGVCVALETNSLSQPIEIGYLGGGYSGGNSAFIRGTPEWSSYETDKAMRYRLHGYYATASGVSPVAGTWEWDAL